AESLPSNSLDPIHGVIDPMQHIPGTNLPDAVAGQSYMLINDVGPNGQIWGNLSADINDIIQYNGNTWEVVFDSSITTDQHYVLNLKSTKQLKWTGEFWQMSVDGQYNPGFWRLFL
ncbi:hypothetical protein, partial [Escherichia coli]|uniref:hypothetical protein n=1 Tax=Escherichia coli TaxID=562 RepID=UPI0013B406F0